MRIAHVITGLGQGGAEATMFRLCKSCPQDIHYVVSLCAEDVYSKRLLDIGVKVYHLDIQGVRDAIGAFPRICRILLRIRPDAVQTWMYHANLYGGIAARLLGIRNLHWGIRHGVLDEADSNCRTLKVVYLGANLSSWIPKYIVSCSSVGASNHVAIGYDEERMKVIPNGLDLVEFFPNPLAKASLLLRPAHLDPSVPVFGMVARYDAYKDFPNLIAALGIIKSQGLEFHCLLAGDCISASNSELLALINASDLLHRVTLLGRRNDIPVVMNAMDFSVLSSRGEAFPNVLAESMACGIPCVTTDAGDARFIVHDTGWVVPCQNSVALAQALALAMTELRTDSSKWFQRKRACRERAQNEFNVDRMVQAYRSLWSKNITASRQT